MEVVKAFNENELHTEIVIKGTMESPLFRASDVGEVLEMGNIRTTIQHFDDTEKVVHSMDTLGGIQNITFLTEKGLYKVLFKSRKPIAEKFQNWVCDVIREIRMSGTYVLQQQLEQATTQIQGIEEKHKEDWEKNKRLEREKIIRREFANSGPLIYIIRVKTCENGQYIIKIGESSKGIEGRYNEHKNKYPECLLLDCYHVIKSRNFEKYLHGHETIRKHIVRDMPNHEKENELFLIGKELTYAMVTRIIENNIKKYNEYCPTDFREMMEDVIRNMIPTNSIGKGSDNTIHNRLDETNNLLHQVLQNQNNILDRIQQMEQRNTPIAKTTTNFNLPLTTLGPRLQKINPENLTLVKTYESVAECLKETKHIIKRSSIELAVRENTVYMGFRWAYRSREDDPNILENIEPTKPSRPQFVGYIAKMDENKTQILNVYLDRKTAAKQNGYKSDSALDVPVKNKKIIGGFHYVLFDECNNDVKHTFIEQYGEPLLYKHGIGQFDKNQKLLQEFICKHDCIKQLQISDKTLAKALDQDTMYKEYYYKTLQPKISMI